MSMQSSIEQCPKCLEDYCTHCDSGNECDECGEAVCDDCTPDSCPKCGDLVCDSCGENHNCCEDEEE